MDGPVCTTRQGDVRGAAGQDGVAVFRAIPYAAPPFGPHRFMAPQPPAAWEGIRDATAFGPTVPKGPYVKPFDVLLPDPDIAGEDCLNLNVWTPDTAGGAPVMVWLHGGAFMNGSGSLPIYDGAAFARDGVVCVSVNYRLGTDGYLSLDGAPDNRGVLDQIAALEWVRDNIAAFGGDPGRVTVFGESAGAMSIGVLLTAPGARGLFHRAILQSGAAHHTIGRDTARKVAAHFAAKLGVEPTAAAFAALPLDVLLPAQTALRNEVTANPDPALWGEVALNAMPFEPIADTASTAARAHPVPGPGADCAVDLLIGTTAEEYRLFTVPSGVIDYIDDRHLRAAIARHGLDPDTALPLYAANRPGATTGDLFSAVLTDWFFRIPAVRLAESVPRAHVYEFGRRSTAFDGRLGACHASEIAFAFDNLDAPGETMLLGEAPPQPLADTMHAAWVSFAVTGDPGWPAYDTRDRTTMVFGTAEDPAHCGPVRDPRPDERALWDGVR
ncbi:carboxylesterase/lipase family protein [Streptomyces sp. NPDC088197]|uniref:carboxylesterase/lipase family protein n=1 Tax=Streptomyces sp. NPDC088197 TaxID=3365840 RepID=UPI00380322EC